MSCSSPPAADRTRRAWGWKPQAGDSVGQWIKKLWEAFAPSWYVGFFPKQAVGTVQKFGFQFRSPLTMTDEPSAYVWLAADGVDVANYPETGTRTPSACTDTARGFSRTLLMRRPHRRCTRG